MLRLAKRAVVFREVRRRSFRVSTGSPAREANAGRAPTSLELLPTPLPLRILAPVYLPAPYALECDEDVPPFAWHFRSLQTTGEGLDAGCFSRTWSRSKTRARSANERDDTIRHASTHYDTLRHTTMHDDTPPYQDTRAQKNQCTNTPTHQLVISKVLCIAATISEKASSSTRY